MTMISDIVCYKYKELYEFDTTVQPKVFFMFKRKEGPYYIKYYLFGIRIWKRQRNSKEAINFILSQMENHCSDMQSIIRKNTKKILKYVDEHYQEKKATPKKRK